jgi:hypothetical protein
MNKILLLLRLLHYDGSRITELRSLKVHFMWGNSLLIKATRHILEKIEDIPRVE